MNEPFLEPILRKMRISSVLPYVKKYPNCKLLDIGCGWEAKLLTSLEPLISNGVGVDIKAPSIDTKKIKTISARFDRELPFENGSFDLITMLAVLEHLGHPLDIINECARLLRPGGGLLLTVPSWYAKPVLEFLAFKVGIVNADEISDHKQYFNKEDLISIFSKITKFNNIEHNYFQWGFNNRLFVVRK